MTNVQDPVLLKVWKIRVIGIVLVLPAQTPARSGGVSRVQSRGESLLRATSDVIGGFIKSQICNLQIINLFFLSLKASLGKQLNRHTHTDGFPRAVLFIAPPVRQPRPPQRPESRWFCDSHSSRQASRLVFFSLFCFIRLWMCCC